jgi:hypothetical protein
VNLGATIDPFLILSRSDPSSRIFLGLSSAPASADRSAARL